MHKNVTEVLGEIEVIYKHASGKPKNLKFTCSREAVEIAKKLFNQKTINIQEEFIVAYLNHANRIIGLYTASKGGINATHVDSRIIFGVGLKMCSTGMILFHNHPSGTLTPSQSDIDLTKKFQEGGKILNINVLDHIIVTPGEEYYSFADNGQI